MRLAVLISGQLSRFARDHMNLNASALGRSGLHVDVHMVLAKTTYSRDGAPATAVSPHHQSEEALRTWLLDRVQAADASVTLISAKMLEHQMAQLNLAVASVDEALWQSTEAMRRAVIHGNIVRWHHNGRMLLLRHLAFLSAVRAEVRLSLQYSWTLCLREDNRFLEPSVPLPKEAIYALRLRHERGRPLLRGHVAFDTHCGFGGAPSDKIFFADRQGSASLFGNSTAAHVGLLVRWLRFGLERLHQARAAAIKQNGRAAAKVADPLQSEAFLLYHLKAEHVAVQKWQWARTDVRFESATATASGVSGSHSDPGSAELLPCVRPLYYSCAPSLLRERRLVPMCRPATPHDRELWRKLGGHGEGEGGARG